MSELHERLKARRLDLGLSPRQAIAQIGISRQHLYQLESGKSQPGIFTLQVIARAYQTTVGALIGETTAQPPGKRDRARLILERALIELEALDREEVEA